MDTLLTKAERAAWYDLVEACCDDCEIVTVNKLAQAAIVKFGYNPHQRPHSSVWNAERDRTLCERWVKGETAAVIGTSFGLSRSAVMGRLHRLGMSKHSRKKP